MAESKLNTSIVPLNAKGLYIGQYENIAQYSSAVISIFSDTDTTISAYQSLNKQLSNVTIFNGTSNIQSNFLINPIILPYIYFIVRNPTTTYQSVLNFSVCYKNASYPNEVPATSNVNIVSQSLPNLNVLINNENNINTAVVANGNSSAIWFNDTFTPGKANIISLAVGSQGFKQISIFGNVAAACNLTIAYSQDGSTWFNSSLGQIAFTEAADFSRDWTSSAYYIGIYSDAAVAAELYYSLQV
jgi:hypothetical protein